MHRPGDRARFIAITAAVVTLCAARADGREGDAIGTVQMVSVVVGGYETITIDAQTLICYAGKDISRPNEGRVSGGPRGSSYAATIADETRFPLVVRYSLAGGARIDDVLATVRGSPLVLLDSSPLSTWIFPHCRPSAAEPQLWTDMLSFGGRTGREGAATLVAEWSAWEAGGQLPCVANVQPLVGGRYQCWRDLQDASRECISGLARCGELGGWWRRLGSTPTTTEPRGAR